MANLIKSLNTLINDAADYASFYECDSLPPFITRDDADKYPITDVTLMTARRAIKTCPFPVNGVTVNGFHSPVYLSVEATIMELLERDMDFLASPNFDERYTYITWMEHGVKYSSIQHWDRA